MKLSLKPEHLQRYQAVARLLIKYGRTDLVTNAGLEDVFQEARADENGSAPVEDAEELARELEQLGPTFIKLGQVLSTRPDLIPTAYIESLTRLQDRVGPFPFDEVERIVTSELGVRLSKAFSFFDPEPIAAASLGQVHSAALRDGWRVAVKVQRPGIREQALEDFEALEQIAGFLDRHTDAGRRYGFGEMLEEFRRALARELDYRREARNLLRLRKSLADLDRILIPAPVDDYTTSRVLTMDYVSGRKVTALSPLTRMEMDGELLADQLFKGYLKQVLVDGFFHADPHPGNVFVTSDHRLALLDLGMVAEVTPSMQEQLLRLLLAISEGRADDVAEITLTVAERREEADERRFKRAVADLVAQNSGANVSEVQVGRVMLEISRAGAATAIRVPPELTMLGKTLLNLDQVGRTLDPEFDPNAAIRRHAGEIMRHRMTKAFSPGNVLSTVLEMNELVQRLPGRVNRVLDTIANNELRLTVDAFDEVNLVEGLQKIANRVTLGLVIAALIVGAAMLMRVQTRFQILGYPGVAILLFLVAAGAGVGLAWSILTHDRKPKSTADD